MKHIILECTTLGKKPGDILNIGEGEGEISLSNAEILVSEKMAKEYIVPFSDNDRIAELEARIAELEAENALLSTPAKGKTNGKEH